MYPVNFQIDLLSEYAFYGLSLLMIEGRLYI
jgi:hypothetical protein